VPSGTQPGVLLTGATGFLGGEILARLLARESRPVYALVRGADDEEAAARLRGTLRALLGDPDPWEARAIAVAGDVCAPDLGLSTERRDWLAERVDTIIHCAASVSFTLGLKKSREINVAGTARMLDLAERCQERGGLAGFTHVSTAYVAGTHRGAFTEDDLFVGQDFRNAYERSKFEAEMVVRGRGDSLPTQIVRPSIVVGDSNTGWTPAFNVLYWPLRAFARGSYPVLPARRKAPVDVVPVNYVADAVLALRGRPGTTSHITAADRASSVGELIDLACEYLDKPTPPVIPPTVYRRAVHPVLVRTGDERRRKALRASETFFPYFAMQVRYDDAHARGELKPRQIEPPPLPEYFGRLMDYAQAAEWGREPVARCDVANRMASTATV
jgi:long-chain acyl-CoA synthetase